MGPFQENNTFYACGEPVFIREDSHGETHVYRASDGVRLSKEDLKGGVVFGGGKGESFYETCVTMESGFLTDLYGGGEGGEVQSVSLTITGGLIGRYLCGGGLDDTVETVEIFALGGVVRHSLFAAGASKKCGGAKLLFDGTVCTNLRLGSKNLQAEICGDLYFTMKSGHIFDLAFGNLNLKGEIFAEIFGGIVEQRMYTRSATEKLHLKLYENIFEPDGHGGMFPRLPEEILFSYLPKKEKEKREIIKGCDDFFFDTKGEEGKLVFRFFSLRNPEVSKEITPFSDFIGDAFLIFFPKGEKMLVDTGMPYSYGEISCGLAKLGVEKIDYLMVTHPHIDHMGNAEKILCDFSVTELWLPDLDAPLSLEEEQMEKGVLSAARKTGTLVRKVGRGDRFQIGEEDLRSEVLILNPKRGDENLKDLNGCSIACKVTFRDSSAILGGDITQREEEEILCDFGGKLKTDLIKLSHHGIVYQNSYRFIEACRPKKAVVQNVRDRGAFIKITSLALEKANGFSSENLFVTGKNEKIKVILTGNEGEVEIKTEV